MSAPPTTDHGGADAPPLPFLAGCLGFLFGAEVMHLGLAGAGVVAFLAAAAAVVALARWRSRPGGRLRQAFRDLGLVHKLPDGCVVEMRQVGFVKRDGPNQLIRWKLPPGVTLDDVRRNEEAIGHRAVCAVSTWMEKGLLHMQVLGHPLPDHVEFTDFYRASRPPQGELMIGLGCGHRGPLWVDLATIPHLLVGGQTGAGKSVFLRQLLTGLAINYTPDQMRLVLLDLKGGVELAHFAALPHALMPVADTAEAAAAALGWVRDELDRRLALLRGAGMVTFGGEGVAGLPRDLRPPRIIVVLDEVAELVLGHLTGAGAPAARSANKEATGRLGEIARLGRAVGIHLVVCTQRPDADAVPGQLKANLAATVAFRVRAGVNSQILLGDDRAAKLPPRPGRGLWSFDRTEEFQAVYVSEEYSRVVLHAYCSDWRPDADDDDERDGGRAMAGSAPQPSPDDDDTPSPAISRRGPRAPRSGGGVHVTRRPQSPRIEESCINWDDQQLDLPFGSADDGDGGEGQRGC